MTAVEVQVTTVAEVLIVVGVAVEISPKDIQIPAELEHLRVEGAVVYYPAPSLRELSLNVDVFDKELIDFAESLLKTMFERNGIGIAAPQIGKNIRLMIAQTPAGKPHVYVNPKILDATGSIKTSEGCLSIPGLYGTVERKKHIRVEAFTLKGIRFEENLANKAAIVFQHELDHLDGILFFDRAAEESLHWGLPKTSIN